MKSQMVTEEVTDPVEGIMYTVKSLSAWDREEINSMSLKIEYEGGDSSKPTISQDATLIDVLILKFGIIDPDFMSASLDEIKAWMKVKKVGVVDFLKEKIGKLSGSTRVQVQLAKNS